MANRRISESQEPSTTGDMAPEVDPDDGLTNRQREILDEFATFSEIAGEAPDEKPTTMRERAYVPRRFQLKSLPTKGIGEGMSVPTPVTFAAKMMVDALAELAAGKPMTHALLPDDDPWHGRPGHLQSVERFESIGTEGYREAKEDDFERVHAAFEALFGVPPEDFWEVALTKAMRRAIAARTILQHVFVDPIDLSRMIELPIEVPPIAGGDPETPSAAIGGGHIDPPAPPTAAEILAVVEANSPPGTIPEWLTPEVINIGLERCTDARGGGRGKTTAKLTVAKWLDFIKSKIQERGSENSEP